jgi:biotin carboxyl carrier protein
VTLWIDIAGRLRKVELPAPPLTGEIICLIDGRPLKFDANTLAPGLLSLILPGPPAEDPDSTSEVRQYRCILDISPEGEAVVIDGQRVPFAIDDPRSLRARRSSGAGADGPRAVKAPMPGRVLRILVAPGDEVAAHQGLIVIEAMKMQNELKSPKAGRIARIAAQVGETVQSGDILIVVE